MQKACCCSGLSVTPCANCAAKPRGLHVCLVDTDEDAEYAADLAMADSPRSGTSAAGRATAGALEMFNKLRSPDQE